MDIVPESMPLVDSLRVLAELRSTEVVVTTMGTAREWMLLSSHPLDFVYVPSSMGQAPSIGLGLALAQPRRKVIVCNGDGSLLMNLGSLVTITAQAPTNLLHIIFDNGVYEVTGAQQTPAAGAMRADGRRLDLAALGRDCGFRHVFAFSNLDRWKDNAASIMETPGPTFVVLTVAPVPGGIGPRSPGPAAQRAQDFAKALANAS